MREKIDEMMEQMETCEVSAREIILALAVAFLSGVLLGIIFSPKKHIMIASNNGNNNGNDNGNNNSDNSCELDVDDGFEDDED